jgi:hypothetical protein
MYRDMEGAETMNPRWSRRAGRLQRATPGPRRGEACAATFAAHRIGLARARQREVIRRVTFSSHDAQRQPLS